MKSINNKFLRLVCLSVSLATLNINSIEAKIYEYAQEENFEEDEALTLQQRIERENINFLTDNFIEFYENEAVKNPILRGIVRVTPLIDWLKSFILII